MDMTYKQEQPDANAQMIAGTTRMEYRVKYNEDVLVFQGTNGLHGNLGVSPDRRLVFLERNVKVKLVSILGFTIYVKLKLHCALHCEHL
ncbi:hypothetical protein LTR17_020325 [Elasticomyces elasticus]|nr:hypothetical protein LTR17_020325 [Elasticomyces elasticus]